MTFAQGSTRYVIKTSRFAIKISKFRIPILNTIKRFIYWKNRGELVKKIKERNGALVIDFFTQMKNTMFAGIKANKEEARFYQRNPNLPLAPTVYSFLGIVNIQLAGKPIDNEQFHERPFANFSYLDVDLLKPQHFGWIGNRICLLDYGSTSTQSVIEEALQINLREKTFDT